MNTILQVIFILVIPGAALLSVGSGCAVTYDLAAPQETTGTVTSGTLTVEDAAPSAAELATALPDGGVFELPSNTPNTSGADAGQGSVQE